VLLHQSWLTLSTWIYVNYLTVCLHYVLLLVIRSYTSINYYRYHRPSFAYTLLDAGRDTLFIRHLFKFYSLPVIVWGGCHGFSDFQGKINNLKDSRRVSRPSISAAALPSIGRASIGAAASVNSQWQCARYSADAAIGIWTRSRSRVLSSERTSHRSQRWRTIGEVRLLRPLYTCVLARTVRQAHNLV